MQVASTFPRQTTWTGYIEYNQYTKFHVSNQWKTSTIVIRYDYVRVVVCFHEGHLQPWTYISAGSHNKIRRKGGEPRHPCHQWGVLGWGPSCKLQNSSIKVLWYLKTPDISSRPSPSVLWKSAKNGNQPNLESIILFSILTRYCSLMLPRVITVKTYSDQTEWTVIYLNYVISPTSTPFCSYHL